MAQGLVKVLWCHSHFVWLVFEGSIPMHMCFLLFWFGVVVFVCFCFWYCCSSLRNVRRKERWEVRPRGRCIGTWLVPAKLEATSMHWLPPIPQYHYNHYNYIHKCTLIKTKHTWLASFPGSAHLSATCSTEKWERAWNNLSHEWCRG